jgi:hypothetical protein
MSTKSRKPMRKKDAISDARFSTYDLHKLLIRNTSDKQKVVQQICNSLWAVDHTNLNDAFLNKMRSKIYALQRLIDETNLLITEAQNHEHQRLRKKVRKKVSRWE